MKSLEEIVQNRRTVKPERYTGEAIPDAEVWKILESANWAPTHGHTEPWRFTVFTGKKKTDLIEFLNQLDAELNGLNEVKNQKRQNRIEAASHVISISMKRGSNEKIPELEELLAVAMAVQNMWLTAHDLGLGAYWSTGSLAFRDELREFLLLEEQDRTLGFFYLGIPIEGLPPGVRMSPVKDKVDWR